MNFLFFFILIPEIVITKVVTSFIRPSFNVVRSLLTIEHPSVVYSTFSSAWIASRLVAAANRDRLSLKKPIGASLNKIHRLLLRDGDPRWRKTGRCNKNRRRRLEREHSRNRNRDWWWICISGVDAVRKTGRHTYRRSWRIQIWYR